ncbi:MAG: hypothetical protein OZSIB_0406 [Candidatus Ozemobacter sibiricus]|uniref:Uncharacterized protein n=1 Tax=Candidatus Ozemobacter sibiricus TaxID=2268124 RepID=A0A367ZLS2_9BACT|nr:MAG: hypothetical protein OZSIB_0406 [Candidatus Ozemobacter sibiricus]
MVWLVLLALVWPLVPHGHHDDAHPRATAGSVGLTERVIHEDCPQCQVLHCPVTVSLPLLFTTRLEAAPTRDGALSGEWIAASEPPLPLYSRPPPFAVA